MHRIAQIVDDLCVVLRPPALERTHCGSRIALGCQGGGGIPGARLLTAHFNVFETQVEATYLVPDGAALAAMIAQALMAKQVGAQQGLGPGAAAAGPAADGDGGAPAADGVPAAADGVAAAAADAPGQNGVAGGAEPGATAAAEASAAASGGGADGAAATGPAGVAAMEASEPTAAPADDETEPAPGGA